MDEKDEKTYREYSETIEKLHDAQRKLTYWRLEVKRDEMEIAELQYAIAILEAAQQRREKWCSHCSYIALQAEAELKDT